MMEICKKINLLLKNGDNRALIAEIFRYLISGVSVTVLNIVLYTVLVLFDVKYTIANLVSIVVAKVYAYLINKFYVYRHRAKSWKDLAEEILKFAVVRGSTGVLDYFGVVFLVEMLSFDSLIAKYFVTLLVIVLNYILGKKYVFYAKN